MRNYFSSRANAISLRYFANIRTLEFLLLTGYTFITIPYLLNLNIFFLKFLSCYLININAQIIQIILISFPIKGHIYSCLVMTPTYFQCQ